LKAAESRALIEIRMCRERVSVDVTSRVAWRQYHNAMVRACRVGLADHPEVSGWVKSRQLLGDVDTLRAARRGLEKGVRPPMRLNGKRRLRDDADLFGAIVDLLSAGWGAWSEIQAELEKRGRIPRMQRIQFLRIVEHLGLKDGRTKRTASRLRVGPSTLHVKTVSAADMPTRPTPPEHDDSFAAQTERARVRYRLK
jgi:hypothetical protein